jgi:hypothetical protein
VVVFDCGVGDLAGDRGWRHVCVEVLQAVRKTAGRVRLPPRLHGSSKADERRSR